MATLLSLGPDKPLDASLLEAKQRKLFDILRPLDRVLVAYSGGTDSAYLAWAAHQALGERASPSPRTRPPFPNRTNVMPPSMLRVCGFRHELIPTFEFDNPGLRQERRRPLLSLQGRVVHAPGRQSPPSAASSTSSTASIRTTSATTGRVRKRPRSIEVKAPLVEAGLSKARDSRTVARRRACRSGTARPRPASAPGCPTARP